ncbi:MAG: hypothetical protein ACRCVN_07000 [Spirochaetia bacterium]
MINRPVFRLSLFMFLCLVFVSCGKMAFSPHDPQYAQQVAGLWERYGDESEGDIIKIEQRDEKSQPIGVLVKVSAHSALFGYQKGDIKWKLVKVHDKSTILVDNLNATITREHGTGRILNTTKNYGPFLLKRLDKKNLSLQSTEKGQEARIGNQQTWRLIENQ